jgi:hydroxymethylpyrimidine pyrophosphatase-like HAD family hydrolase
MQYKALIFDLDGTAIPNGLDSVPSRRIIAAVQQARGHIKLCSATGRPVTNALPILSSLALVEPCIIAGGTQIIDPTTGKILWEKRITPPDVQAVLEVCAPYDNEVIVKDELEGQGAPARERRGDTEVNVMCVMSCTSFQGTQILQRLKAVPGVSASDVLSWTGKGLDIHITAKSATKGHAVARLREIIGVSKAEIIGVGDNNNDVDLFREVGYKIAMANATDSLKAVSDFICGSVEQDGLATLIEDIAHAGERRLTYEPENM